MANFGIKISKGGTDVKDKITTANAQNFQLISSIGCLVKKEESEEDSAEYMWWGAVLDGTTARSANFYPQVWGSLVKKFIIFANKFDE